MDHPKATLIEQAHEIMLDAWKRETGSAPSRRQTAFDAACWRVASFLDEWYDPPHDVGESVIIACHAKTWLRPREDWEPPPQLLCDVRSGKKRYLFWLVDREEAERQGDEI